ncbi:MAG: ferrous iron transporter B [Clostridia bacterium]|nr:ferrous iron transporter B [Clostridia bacterium]
MRLTKSSTGKNLKSSSRILNSCDYSITLAGNPNTGKSTIFNSLTGMKQHTGNWTGKTVENAYGVCKYKSKSYLFVDIPGTYSLLADSEEEKIAKDYIKSGITDVTVVVVDATRLERNLNLVYQIFNLTNNVIVCVNLLDEASNKGISINLELLSKELGVPVVGTIGKKRSTLYNLLKTIYLVCSEKILCNPIKVNSSVEKTFQKAQNVTNKVCTFINNNYNERDKKIDAILTSKKYGIPIMILFFCIIFWITIVGANYPSELLSRLFSFFQPLLNRFLIWIHCPNIIVSLIIDGIYKTVTWIISVMLPPMAIFFPLFTILEDLGYLPRIAFNLDKCFRKCHTSGKQSLTMCMGFGCNAAGVIGCRIISSPRERLIAILTNNFVPCNGRFPLLITIAVTFFSSSTIRGIDFLSGLVATLVVSFIVMIGIGFTFLISSVLSKTILKGKSEGFILELPPYRKPQVLDVLTHSFIDRTFFVLSRALSIALPSGIVIWCLSNINIGNYTLLNYIANFFDPFAKLMGLDGYILTAFILGMPANEIVLPIILMCYLQGKSLINIDGYTNIFNILIEHHWTIITALNVMIFSLLHFPCGTTLLTIYKETKSKKWTILSLVLPTLCGIIACMCTNFGWCIWNFLH